MHGRAAHAPSPAVVPALALTLALALAGCTGVGSETERPASWAGMNAPDAPPSYENVTLMDEPFSLGAAVPEMVLDLAVTRGSRNATLTITPSQGAAESFSVRLGPCSEVLPAFVATSEPYLLPCPELDGLTQQVRLSLRTGAIAGHVTVSAESPVQGTTGTATT